MDEIFEVIKDTPQERVVERILELIVHVPLRGFET